MLHVCYPSLSLFFFFFVEHATDLHHEAKDDPRRVVIKEMRVIFEDRPDGDIVYTLDSKEELDKMKHTPFVMKEGSKYKIRVTFRVQHDIVSGLKYVNTVYRKGIRGMLALSLSYPFIFF